MKDISKVLKMKDMVIMMINDDNGRYDGDNR